MERVWLVKAKSLYGVNEAVIMGIWGMETEYGVFEGSDNVIRALASLAYVRYRGDYFRDELILALSILQEGDISPRRMLGSWAGAMGQPQFMPSSFLDFAVDFDGRGRRDIWTDSADTIGSIANYLANHGWKPDLPWGFEVHLPQDFKLTAADSAQPASFASFARRGATRADGGPLPAEGDAWMLLPAGSKGPIFLVTDNFLAIKSYNNSTSYALGVALLGDAIFGQSGLRTPWPISERVLSSSQIRNLQARLKELGYNVGEVDGLVGDIFRSAIRAYQVKIGAPPDGYPTLTLLKEVNAKH